MIEKPKRIKPFNFRPASLLPVYPPEIDSLFFHRRIDIFEISLYEAFIGKIKINRLFVFFINTHVLCKFNVAVLKKTDSLRRMNIEICFKSLFVKHFKEPDMIGKKLRIPTVTRPSGIPKAAGNICNRIFWLWVVLSFIAEALFNINPVPVHINTCHRQRNILFLKFIH